MRTLLPPLIILAILLEPTTCSFAAKAKKPKGKAKANKSPAIKRGFGAPVTAKGAKPPLPSVGDGALDTALSETCAMLLKQPKQPQLWLQLGSLLVKANEYAEAERVFRTGAARLPDSELLSAAALTLGGDSAAYYCGSSEAGPAASAAATAAPAHAIDDDNFDAFEAPIDDIVPYDQSDRHIEWSADAKSVSSRGCVFKSRKPLLDPKDCAWAIEQVEAHAAVHGWTQDRHVQAPTTDIPVSSVPAIREWFDDALQSTLFPMVAARFPGAIRHPSELRVLDAFVVRYDAREQASLPTHQDENSFSFTIALNDRSEYEGGGTRFERLRPVGAGEDARFAETILNADAGGCVAFPGKLRHGGHVVTAGRRYIIPLFLYVDANKLGGEPGRPEPGYVLRHLGMEAPKASEGLSRYAQKVVEERKGP